MTRVIAPAFFLLVLLVASPPVAGQVSSERLLRASDEPTNWLTYSGTYFSQRHSLLKQIDVTNATALELKWVFQAQTLTSVSATPLVVDGIMYVTQPPNDIVALDAKSGRVFWTIGTLLLQSPPCVVAGWSTAASRSSATPCSWRRSTPTWWPLTP